MLYRISGATHKIEGILWENFDSLKRSLVLLPKIAKLSALNGEKIYETLKIVEKLTIRRYDERRLA